MLRISTLSGTAVGITGEGKEKEQIPAQIPLAIQEGHCKFAKTDCTLAQEEDYSF